jgi:threonyl-tRNA synthetase
VQATVLPVSGKFIEYAEKVTKHLKDAGFRVHLDDRNEKLQAKIRDAQIEKIPYMLIIGGKEAEAGSVAVRHRSKGDLGPRPLGQFVNDLRAEIDSRQIQ